MLNRFDFLMNDEPLLGGSGGNNGGNDPGDPGAASNEPNGGSPDDFKYPASNFPDGVDKDIAGDPSLKVFIKDEQINMANLMKSYVHSQRLIGKDKLIIPDKHATDSDWAVFYDKLGRPAVDGYEINAEGDKEEFVKSFKEMAHEAGLVNKQAQKMYDFFKEQAIGMNRAATEQQQAAYQAELDGLKKEWGDGYDKQLQLANSALKEFAGEKEIEALKESGLANNITLVKIFNKIAQGLKEDTFKEEAHGTFGATPEEAQRRVNDIMGDKGHPYHDRSHPSHTNAVQEVQKLFEKIYK